LPDFEILFAGSDVLENADVSFAIGDRDHPVAKLLQVQNKISKGHAGQISLRIKKVVFDLPVHFICLIQ